MNIVPDLMLEFDDRPFEVAARPSRSWDGFAIEHVEIEETEPYRFHWSGKTHYLALHDILLDDGGSVVDNLRPDATRDLRDTITFLPSGSAIDGWSLPAKRRNSFTALYFDPSVLRDDLELRYRTTSLRPILYTRDGVLHQTMHKLAALIADPHADSMYAESACILAAIEVLSLKPPETRGVLSSRQLAAVSEYIAAHLTDDISLSDLATVANLSRYHFSRAFKASTGQSPYAFVVSRRVERASELLANRDLPMERVAAASGFSSTAQLRRHFQQLKRQTLRDFRRGSR